MLFESHLNELWRKLYSLSSERLNGWNLYSSRNKVSCSLGCSQAINQSHKIAAADTGLKLLRCFYFLKINLSLFSFYTNQMCKDNTTCLSDWSYTNLKYLEKVFHYTIKNIKWNQYLYCKKEFGRHAQCK